MVGKQITESPLHVALALLCVLALALSGVYAVAPQWAHASMPAQPQDGATYTTQAVCLNRWWDEEAGSYHKEYRPVAELGGEERLYFELKFPELDDAAGYAYCDTPGATFAYSNDNGGFDVQVKVTSVDMATGEVTGEVSWPAPGDDWQGGAYGHVTFHRDYTGSIAIDKDSSNPSVSDSNACYSMAGIVYSVFTDASCTQDTGYDLVLDSAGRAQIDNIPLGTYYVKEDDSGLEQRGFFHNDTVYTATVEPNTTANVVDSRGANPKDEPGNDPIQIVLNKEDPLSSTGAPSGIESLAGALFEVCYYDGYYATADLAEASGNPERTWVFQTDESGKIVFDDMGDVFDYYLVSGDDLYLNAGGTRVTFPLGTYTLRETKAPTGYVLPDNPGANSFTISISDSTTASTTSTAGTVEYANSYAEASGFEIDNTPVRLDFSFVKVRADTQARMAGVPFLVKRYDADTGRVIEQHVVVTDANGRYDSSADVAKHTKSTNASDAAVTVTADGSQMTLSAYTQSLASGHEFNTVSYSVDETRLNAEAGLWFSKDFWGNDTVAASDAYGAIPDSPTVRFSIEELPVAANDGLQLVDVALVAHSRKQGSSVDLGTITDSTLPQPQLSTSATDSTDSDQVLSRDTNVGMSDTVAYANLEPGSAYTLTGTLMDRKSGEPIRDASGNTVTATRSFTPSSSSGTTTLEFALDATTVENGSKIVVFEKLSTGGLEVASHTDIDEDSQTVTVSAPRVVTSAKDAVDGDSVVAAGRKSSIRDTVTYAGLTPGQTYTVSGALMDKKSGEPIRDTSGNTVTATSSFTADAASGTTDVTFEFDAGYIEDGTMCVVFESIYHDGTEVASHADLDDAAQTVVFRSPSIATKAHDADDGDSYAMADSSVEIDDVVSYSNLIPGLEYELSGRLVDKETGATFSDSSGHQAVSSATFTPTSSSGTETVTFSFDASALGSTRELVAFETLYEGGRKLAEHADIDDAAQTVKILKPAISTSAVDAADSDHVIDHAAGAHVIDSVSYSGLMANADYVLEGVLMDKATGKPVTVEGNTVTASTKFTPRSDSGIIAVAFAFDATGLAGRDLVVFETLKDASGEVAATHADIDDAAQTVHVAEAEIPLAGNDYAKTGSATTGPWPAVLALMLSCTGVLVIAAARRWGYNIG